MEEKSVDVLCDNEEIRDFSVLGVFVSMEPSDDYEEFEIDGSLVILEGPIGKITVNGTEMLIREGIWCEMDEEGEYQPDWALTWIYTDPVKPQDYVYFEQDPMETALYNFLHSMI